MKLFLNQYFKLFSASSCLLIVSGLIFQSCATHHAQFGKNIKQRVSALNADTLEITHTIFLLGDAGNTNKNTAEKNFGSLKTRLKQASKNSTLLFLGDNIYPKGLPEASKTKERLIAESKLTNQLQLSKGFKGKTIVIPGNHDWYSGIKGLERQAKFVTDYLADPQSFLPRKSCGIDAIDLNKNLTIITIDSQWFLEDWDKIPTINDECTIKTREAFFIELEDLLIKNQEKTVILALHHPLLNNGSHGGQFSLKKQLFPLQQKIPLPIIGSLLNFFRKTSGLLPQDNQNKYYRSFANQIKIILQNKDNVIVVSGHDHNLQYIEKDKIKQIISGAGSKSEAAKAVFPNDFSFGKQGYVCLNMYKNGATAVSFYGQENGIEKLLFQRIILKKKEDFSTTVFPKSFPLTTVSSVYDTKQTQKSKFYRFLFGEHYRKYYSIPITAKTATIDTLFGGLTPKVSERDYQSNALQLFDNKGKQYTMRAVKQNTTRYLGSVIFQNHLKRDEFDGTYAESLLSDFYTTGHPYTPLSIGNLADKIDVSHTNPSLFYIPKHSSLKQFNSDFGNELYIVEEYASSGQKSLKSFGNPDAIINTKEVLKNIRKDSKYVIDESAYIKARLFDILIGDWDRNEEQWRWGEYTTGEKVVYKPIPLDRDQAFSKYDGALVFILMKSVVLRNRQSFEEKIKNVKILNREPYSLDLALLKNSNEETWIKQAKYIEENLSDQEIEAAFTNLPDEVKDNSIAEIKKKLKLRKNDLQQAAAEYYKVLQHTVVIVGTDKKDKFIIQNTAKNKLEIQTYQLKTNGYELRSTKSFNSKETKRIWIYGLDDDDLFEVMGATNSGIKIRLIGGQNNDSYIIENGRNVKIHDFKSKENTFKIDKKTKILLSDDYESNLYDYKKPKYNVFSSLPNIGFNPDDGIKLGVITGLKINGFKQNPYTQKHDLKINYYFATNGYEALYNAQFPKLFEKWDFEIQSQYASPNFTINYFGYGNQTRNNDVEFGRDFNRVRIRMLKVLPSIKKVVENGSIVQLQASFEQIGVEKTTARFVDLSASLNPAVFQNQLFAGAVLKYSFENYDFPGFPAMGMGFSIAGSWKVNLENTKRNFPTIESKLNFNHKIDANGKLVFATIIKGKAILNNNFEFYQGAHLGGDYDLRGFRNERFLGNKSFYQSSDLRWDLGKIKRSVIPMTFGVLAGFDYGRVWLTAENSEKWHQSVGGGLWLNGLNSLTARITYFKSFGDDRPRVAFGLGFGF
jgi:predicted phosphodiesterase